MDGGLESRCVGRVYGTDCTLLHQVVISNYLMRKLHGQTTFKLPLLFGDKTDTNGK
jgi:hypothetical protein